MSDVLFPAAVRGLGYTVLVRDEWNNLVQEATNGYEVRLALWNNPIHHWELIYNVLLDKPGNIASGLTQTDLRTMRGFFNARQANFDDFLYQDPDDNAVVDGALQLVEDANGTWYSPVQREMGGAYEDITDLNGGIAVKANGSPTSDYALSGPGLGVAGQSFMGLYLTWNAMPTAPITATFNFYYRVRFETNAQDFEKFVNQMWTAGGDEAAAGSSSLKLVSARKAPQI